MSEFTNKVSFKDIALEDNLKDIILFRTRNANTDEDVDIQVLPYLPIEKMGSFVMSVMDFLFVDEDYLDTYKSFIIRKTFIEYYTNLELPSDLQDCYEFMLTNSSMVSRIIGLVNQEQWNEIIQSIMYQERLITERFIKRNEELDNLYIMANNLISKITNVVETQIENFNGVDVAQVVKNLSKRSLNDDKLIETIISGGKNKKTKTSNK